MCECVKLCVCVCPTACDSPGETLGEPTPPPVGHGTASCGLLVHSYWDVRTYLVNQHWDICTLGANPPGAGKALLFACFVLRSVCVSVIVSDPDAQEETAIESQLSSNI